MRAVGAGDRSSRGPRRRSTRFPAPSRVTYGLAVAYPDPLADLPGMDELRQRVEKRLLAAVESEHRAMTDMASHLVRAGGKRLRPVLSALASAVGRADVTVLDEAVTGGVACELVHVGSLHHDDVIDEARSRHGVDSVNARWGNLRAILSGDFLLARASELAATLGTEVAGVLAATIGRLCTGEVLELELAYRVDRSPDDYAAAVDGKTAALYATACRIGGLVAGVPRPHVEALTAFGRHYGTAFQVVDDILDVVAADEELGKPAGHDMAEGIYTLPVLCTLRGPAGRELRDLLGGPLSDDARARALAIVRSGDGVEQALVEARAAIDRAVAHLADLPPTPATTALAAAARHLLAGVERGAG